LVGASSGTSGIVVAHELIHRESRLQRVLGHLLLCSVCYDHFVIAHQRGHHDHLGMPDDIATARFGESFEAYWRRVYKGYFSYAWRSECERLGIDPNLWQLKLFKHQVLLGLTIELLLLIGIVLTYGWLAAAMFLYQAFAAVRILEAVNYFQHWGLGEGRVGNTYGWVTTSWLSRYALIGLSNHIGHHQNAASRYYEIAYSERGPKMPYGYFVMNLWVKLHNASYRKMAEKELLNFYD
jgi:alkane 1-monooxygenase